MTFRGSLTISSYKPNVRETSLQKLTGQIAIDKVRNEIDQLDYEMIQIVEARLQKAAEISGIKKEMGQPLEQPERFAYILRDRSEKATELRLEFVHELFHLLHQESLRTQKVSTDL